MESQNPYTAMFMELVKLRVSVARIAQAMNVETNLLRVKDMPFEELHALAMMQSRGWNLLAANCADEGSAMLNTIQNLGQPQLNFGGTE